MLGYLPLVSERGKVIPGENRIRTISKGIAFSAVLNLI